MAERKKAVDLGGTPRRTLNRLSNVDTEVAVNARGIGGDPLREPVPEYITAKTDKVIKNGNNAWIVLGRDRPASLFSGYGGRGDTQASAIDIVAGRMGHAAAEVGVTGDRTWVNPNFKMDAARIYVSQKADIDDYFGLANGTTGNAKTKSAAAIKADAVRLIGREGIKLVTKTDAQNSQGGQVVSVAGIDLIAGNDSSDMQPIPKGIYLRDALKKITDQIDKLNGIVDSLLLTQMTFNAQLSAHFHISPFMGLPTAPDPVLIAGGIKATMEHMLLAKMSLISNKMNIAFMRLNYFQPFGGKYINSRFNNTN